MSTSQLFEDLFFHLPITDNSKQRTWWKTMSPETLGPWQLIPVLGFVVSFVYLIVCFLFVCRHLDYYMLEITWWYKISLIHKWNWLHEKPASSLHVERTSWWLWDDYWVNFLSFKHKKVCTTHTTYTQSNQRNKIRHTSWWHTRAILVSRRYMILSFACTV